MLAQSEPRGLPGAAIDRIEFQRADDGFPLDDVIVRAHDNLTGRAATLQIQVKRSIAFAPSDEAFRKVVGQIAEAIKMPDFWIGRNELAIATARTSRKTDGAYQDVLKWARQLGSAQTFFDRLNRPGTGNDDMRTFVRTLRHHLNDAAAPDDDQTIWKLLGRLQILVFDYTSVGSASEELSKERAVRVLPPENAMNARTLWGVLTDLAEEIAADGGDRDRARLVANLTERNIPIGGARHLASVRAAVADESAQALADIGNRIGATTLARSERVAATNEALDRGRYVEIRGDAGVGKSGVLRHFAELFEIGGRIVVLSPGRVAGRGWAAMRARLGVDTTARDFLSDLASDGGAALLIDNLDSFGDEERRTANDLLRAAAEVPGVVVIATARRNFGVYEPSWLDSDAVKALGPAPPVVIEELSDSEVVELSEEEPHLAGLLANDHPAREVVRNLYRLSRLASRPASSPTPTSELDMAEQWWRSADGERDNGHRERARLLRTLGELVLGGAFVMDVKGEPVAPIDALIRSETLRDLGNDRVTFHHDVLRQWAIGILLVEDDLAFEKLPLAAPASAVLARGVELAGRFALALGQNGDRWAAILERLSTSGTHMSWRRAVLLALVHSENSVVLLGQQANRLLNTDAALLRELIRTVMAVDAEPASQLLAKLGVDPAQVPTGMFVPSGTSWVHLIVWLLKLGAKIPGKALGDVTDLYTNWMFGTFGVGPITPRLLAWLNAWLVEIEEEEVSTGSPRTYTGTIRYREIHELAEKIRTGFLLFANKTPELAATYLNQVRARQHNERAVASIMKFRGTLAQAAPRELAALTAEGLIAERTEEDDAYRGREREEPFQFLDHQFHPAAPAQGPFLELLTHARDEGLWLVRELVAHAIRFNARGRDAGDDSLLIRFDDAERSFPWTGTYRWSRGESGHYALGSALMALEAWAHKRLEAGDTVDEVLKDVLGPDGSPAAVLLVAVDLIISHWPKSRVAAVPFLGCPELVSLDRTRQTQDQIEFPDLFGLSSFEKEPTGAATRASLKQRSSRGVPLERLVGTYGAFGPEDLRTNLKRLLGLAAERLGRPDATSNFADARFMAQHELNLLDPSNWQERVVATEEGSRVQGREYVPPKTEAQHLAALTAGMGSRLEAANLRAALLVAIENPFKSSPQLAAQAVAWAQEHAEGPTSDEEEDEDRDGFLRTEGLRAAALVVIRDGSNELRREYGGWAERVLMDALNSPDDVAHRMRAGLKFNAIATAFAGIAERYRQEPGPTRLRTLLEIAARENPAGAHGFAFAAAGLAELDERIPKAIIRCAFTAAVKPFRHWDVDEEEKARRTSRYAAQRAKAVEDEFAWLNGSGPEPAWPLFEAEGMRPIKPRRRPRIIIGDSSVAEVLPEEPPEAPTADVDEQAAGLWVGSLWPLADVFERPWLREFVRTYADFSAHINGLGLRREEEPSRSPSDWWNANYYPLLARTMSAFSEGEIRNVVLNQIAALPDEPFFDVVREFLRAVDINFFHDRLLQAEAPVIRRILIDRLRESSGWHRIVGDRSGSVEFHLGPAMGTIFFNDYMLGRSSCYLTANAIDRIEPFLPGITDLAASGPSYFAAVLTMDLLEVSPHPRLLPLLVAAAKAWVGRYADDTGLWIEHGIGRRVCAWLDRLLHSHPEALLGAGPEQRRDVDMVLAALVRVGVAEARQLETSLAGS